MSDGFSKRPITKPNQRLSFTQELAIAEKETQKEKEELIKNHLKIQMRDILAKAGLEYANEECVYLSEDVFLKIFPDFDFNTGEEIFEDDDRKRKYGLRYNIGEKSIFASYWHYYRHPRFGLEYKGKHKKIYQIED